MQWMCLEIRYSPHMAGNPWTSSHKTRTWHQTWFPVFSSGFFLLDQSVDCGAGDDPCCFGWCWDLTVFHFLFSVCQRKTGRFCLIIKKSMHQWRSWETLLLELFGENHCTRETSTVYWLLETAVSRSKVLPQEVVWKGRRGRCRGCWGLKAVHAQLYLRHEYNIKSGQLKYNR